MDMLISGVQYALFFVILIGVLVFVHEGGHFIFAKLFKVKVLAFSLGFGPKLFGFTRGETTYKVSLVPIGGYVKMLGEDPTEHIDPLDKGRAFTDQALWKRAVIILGGPGMNMIFPLFLMFGVGLTHTEITPAELGVIFPGNPAYEAGVRSGDVVVAIGDEKVVSEIDLLRIVSTNPGKELTFTIARGGETVNIQVTPKAVELPIMFDETKTVGRIGVMFAYLKPLVGISDPSSIAATSGLDTFDLITSVNGKPVKRLGDLEKHLIAAAGSTAKLELLKLKTDAKPPFYPFDKQFDEKVHTVTIAVADDIKGLSDLGIEPSSNYVAHVTKDGVAEKIGIKRGDRLDTLDSKDLPLGQIYIEIDRDPKLERTLAWTSAGISNSAKFKPQFIPAGEAGDLGVERDTYDKGFWGLHGMDSPNPVKNPAVFMGALKFSWYSTVEGFKLISLGFKLLIERKISFRSLGGPIMIGQLAGQAGKAGPYTFFWIMALISLNLGLINLVPIPVLDGGQLTIIALEAITRRPLNAVIKERMMLVGVAMLLVLMVFATWNDIARVMLEK